MKEKMWRSHVEVGKEVVLPRTRSGGPTEQKCGGPTTEVVLRVGSGGPTNRTEEGARSCKLDDQVLG